MADLSDVAVGDAVALTRGFGGRITIHPVIKVTHTQVVIGSLGDGSEWRFWRKNGQELGQHGYHSCRIRRVTQAIEQQIARDKALESLQRTNWKRFETPVLLTVVELIASTQRSASSQPADAVEPSAADPGTPPTRA